VGRVASGAGGLSLLWFAAWLVLAHGQEVPAAHELDLRVEELLDEHRGSDAFALAEESLALRRAQLPEGHAEIANSLNNLAAAHNELGQWERAVSFAQEGLAIREAALESDDPAIARSLASLGSALYSLGEYDEALITLERGLSIVESVFGPRTAGAAELRGDLALVLRALGQYDESLAELEEVLAIQQEVLGPDNPLPASTMTDIGNHLQRMGRYYEAERMFVAASIELERINGTEDLEVARCLNGLATVYLAQGRLQETRDLYERVVATAEHFLGPDHPIVGTTRGNLGSVQFELGQVEASLVSWERALEIVARTYPPGHPAQANAKGNLAMVVRATGDHERAIDLLEDALAIVEAAFGPNHPALAEHLHNLGVVVADVDDYELALEFELRAIEIDKLALGAASPAMGKRHQGMGAIYIERGEYAAAVEQLELALEILEEALGHDHPDIAEVLVWLAHAHNNVDERQGRDYASRAFRSHTRFVAELIDGMTERTAIDYVARNRHILDVFVLSHYQPHNAELGYNAVLQWKGAVARTLGARQEAIRYADTPEVAALADSLRDVRREMAQLTFATWDAGRIVERNALLDELSARRQEVERSLAAASPAYSANQGRWTARVPEVCAAMPRRSALVDYLEIDGEYLAFILESGSCHIRRVPLGDAGQMDEAIAAHREALTTRTDEGPMLATRVDGRGERVRTLVWDPLELRTERVIIVPDDAIANVSFAALPLQDQRYLVEDFSLSYLESATDLLRWEQPQSPSSGALVVGDVDYGEPGGSGGLMAMRSGCVDTDFAPLPATGVESTSIGSAWRQAKDSDAILLRGPEASETAFLAAAPGRALIHLATHGFFASGKCRSALESGGVGLDPMLLSGVVLAGANDPRSGRDEDGILTAAEVAALDLRGTELVVLSACETGLGQISSGEGVLGLRRAFAASGARTLVMSLWSVDDAATGDLMEALYAEVLRKRRPRPAFDALRRAQISMLEGNREKYGEGRPSEWAAFVAAGDWR